QRGAYIEKSVIVFGSMEATLTPLMEQIERDHPEVKVFSLPSVDHPTWGRHIDLGVKGQPDHVEPAYRTLLDGLGLLKVRLGPELVRPGVAPPRCIRQNAPARCAVALKPQGFSRKNASDC